MNTSGPVSLVLDLHIGQERFGRRSDPSIDGHFHHPHDLDGPLNDDTTDKIRQYHSDYNNRPLTLSPLRLSLLVRLTVYIVNLCDFYSYRLIGKLTVCLYLQEFNLRNLPVVSSTTGVWCSGLFVFIDTQKSVWSNLIGHVT